jgi:crotonobetainyl-CoA:carnitine CoA-transferase CaiB-like acyl-CoA transferase
MCRMTKSAEAMSKGSGPLAGVKVLELGSMYAAPTACRMLRDFGADVIKVEEPIGGDYARNWQPQKAGVALGFVRLNAGKRSIAIDLRSTEGQDIIRQLAAKVDVVVESFRPGRLEEWNLGYDVLSAENPDLVLTRVSGFGQTGPYSARPGFGTIAETMSGYAFINGWPETPPTSPPFGFADSIAGIAAAYGTAMSLFRRERTGEGDVVDVALYEPLMFILGDIVLRYTAKNEIQQREGNTSGAASPRGIYQAADGRWLSIAASAQRIAERLFVAMGRPDLIEDERYATNTARMSNNDDMQKIVIDWVASMPRAEALEILDRHEVVAAAVNDARDITEDAHFLERTLVTIEHEILGSVKMPGPVLHLESFPGPEYPSVPQIGEHTREVFEELLDIPPAELDALFAKGVLGSPTDQRAT